MSKNSHYSKNQKTLRILSLGLLILLTTSVLALLIPSSRQVILGTLKPLHRSESLIIHSLELKEDYGNQILTLKLTLRNNSSEVVYPLGAQSELQLTTLEGQWISPHTLPNRQTPESLHSLEPEAHWRGEFSWWLEPEHVNQPLRLSWLKKEVLVFEEEGK